MTLEDRIDALLAVIQTQGNLEDLIDSYLAIREVFHKPHIANEVEAIVKDRIPDSGPTLVRDTTEAIQAMLMMGTAVAQTISSMSAMSVIKDAKDGTIN